MQHENQMRDLSGSPHRLIDKKQGEAATLLFGALDSK
jgi:hypothetical protein